MSGSYAQRVTTGFAHPHSDRTELRDIGSIEVSNHSNTVKKVAACHSVRRGVRSGLHTGKPLIRRVGPLGKGEKKGLGSFAQTGNPQDTRVLRVSLDRISP